MGEAALLIAFQQRIDNTIHDQVLATTDLLRAQSLDGVLDIVPAYCSILVSFDPLRIGSQDVTSAIATLRPAAGSRDHGQRTHHVVPVRYGGEDGPDLHGLATSANLTTDEVISLHSRPDYRVYFLGFMPGFAYMGPVPGQVTHPRHSTPRTNVPAGSVGIAGEQTGVYPFASPGGWQIIGRTDVPTWDHERRKPALFATGDLVRFEPTDTVEGPQPSAEDASVPPNPVFEVLEAAPGTLVMDLGRPGYGHLGLSSGGAMDG